MTSDQRKNDSGTKPEDGAGGATKDAPHMSDYLQSPKKKRKSFVLIAPGTNLDSDLFNGIQKFLAAQYPKLHVVVAKSVEELSKYAPRNIILALVDDELADRKEVLTAVRHLKEHRGDGPLPTIFFTNDSPALIADYQNILPLWQEVDDYLSPAEASRHALFAKIKNGIENRNQRRSRRFKVNIPITFQTLDGGDHRFQGEVLDFSIHGALISATEGGHSFSTKDQLVVHFPVSSFVRGKADVLRVSAKVRRVLISGDRAGISWEHLTSEKVATLTEMLISIVDANLSKSAAAARQKYGKLLQSPDAPSGKI